MTHNSAHNHPPDPKEPFVPPTIALILKGYPRLSETFIAQEILQLERRGLRLLIVSLRHPTDRQHHPIHAEIGAAVNYLPEYLHQEPRRMLRAALAVWRRPGFGAALRCWLRDLRRDPSRNRVRRFGQALVLAHELPPSIRQLYAHFIHTPASVTRYAALINGLPWAASAHAKDIWTLPAWELREKLAELQWLVTCTRANCDYLRALSPAPERVALVYHGLDFERFPPPNPGATAPVPRDGTRAPARLISVGRAVPKKGYAQLLEALARLPAELQWQFTHIGGGELRDSLRQQAERLGIGARIRWLGALPQQQVLAEYRQADLFLLASQVVADGDRDGLPNVLMEAQSQRLCCLATRVSGIPELILDGETGVLVPAADPAALIRAPERRRQLAAAGFERVHQQFSVERGIDALLQRLGPPVCP